MTKAPLALLTPMANPTVEREMRRLLPADADYLVGRLVDDAKDSTTRLRRYAENLTGALDQFGGQPLSGVAFACTASSYLVGSAAEAAIAAEAGLPVLWAAGCIRAELERRGARRIAVVSPYPDALHSCALAYWQDAGFTVNFAARVETGSADTRSIYGLGAGAALNAIARARGTDADAILLSGTGMPTLALLDPGGEPPVISSNYCLAKAMASLLETEYE